MSNQVFEEKIAELNKKVDVLKERQKRFVAQTKSDVSDDVQQTKKEVSDFNDKVKTDIENGNSEIKEHLSRQKQDLIDKRAAIKTRISEAKKEHDKKKAKAAVAEADDYADYLLDEAIQSVLDADQAISEAVDLELWYQSNFS